MSRVTNLLQAHRLLLLIIAVSVVVRLASAFYHGNSIQPLPGVTDQISYHELAKRVIDGHGFSFGTGWWPATRANQPTAHWSFLYVLYLAAVYAVAGITPLAARLIQAVLVGVLHPLLVYRLGSRIFNPAVGLASAAVTAVYGYFVFYGGALVTESFYFLAFLWVLDLATGLAFASDSERSNTRSWLLLGIALGVTALLRQTFLLVAPVILAWLIRERWRRRTAAAPRTAAIRAIAIRATLALVVTAACILPWTVRNYMAFGQFVLLNTNAGYVFFYGAHPVHGNTFIPIMADGSASYQALMPRDVRKLNEAQIERVLLLRGIGFVTADPVRYLRLSASRAVEFVKFWPTPDSGRASNLLRMLSFGLVMPLLAVGATLSLRRRHDDYLGEPSGALLIALVAAVYTVVHLLTWTLVRYRLPVDAIAMPFAGVAIIAALARLRGLAPTPHGSLGTSAS